jgi:hypothetical protein
MQPIGLQFEVVLFFLLLKFVSFEVFLIFIIISI